MLLAMFVAGPIAIFLFGAAWSWLLGTSLTEICDATTNPSTSEG